MQKQGFVIIRNHVSDLLTQEIIYRGTYQNIDYKKFGLSFSKPHFIYHHPSGDIIWRESHVKEIDSSKLSLEQYKDIIEIVQEILDNYDVYLNKIKKNPKSVIENKESLLEFFDKSMKVGCVVCYFTFENALEKKLTKEEINSISPEQTETAKLAIALSKLSKKEDLSKLADDFGYLGMKYFSGHPYTMDELSNLAKNSRKLEQKIKPNSKIKSEYLKIVEKMLSLRTRQWELMCLAGYLFRKAIVENFPKLKYDKLTFLSMDEIVETLYKNLDYEKIVNNRNEFTIEVTDKGVEIKSNNLNLNEEESLTGKTSELKGQIAFKGKVIGKAKIVLSPKDFHKVNSGDILVATMSTPDFLPVMMEASAFVTDIGGITSHVAIVSRELKKPCIIGTKFATKIIKDGDLVEVDANKGIVKILKKA